MLNATCISRVKNKNGHIVAYELRDVLGNVMTVKEKALKEAMRAGKISIDNLKFTQDGKLIEAKKQVKQELSPVEKSLLKRKLLGTDESDLFSFTDDFKKLVEVNPNSKNPMVWRDYGTTHLESTLLIPPVQIIGKLACLQFIIAKDLIIPEGVEVIEAEAFRNCTVNGTINLPSTLREIGDRAFSRLKTNMDELVIGDNITEIGIAGFYCSTFKSIKIGKSIKEITVSCFKSMTKLEKVSIPGSVKTISAEAFYYCERLNEIRLPEGLESVSLRAFCECINLSVIEIPSTVNYIGTGVFKIEPERIRKSAECDIIIRSKMIILGYEAFANRVIRNLKIDGAVKFHPSCFEGVRITGKVILPRKLIDDSKEIFEKAQIDGTIVIPSSWGKVPEGMFWGAQVEKVIIENGITEICELAFEKASIKCLCVPDTLSKIGERAFADCNIEKIVTRSEDEVISKGIPDTVSVVEKEAFFYSRIRGLNFPKYIHTLGDRAFYNCGLQGDIELNSQMSIGETALALNSVQKIILGPLFEIYGTQAEDGAFGGKEVCNEFVVSPENKNFTKIGKMLCSKDGHKIFACESAKLKCLVLPEQFTTIGSYAFSSLIGLEIVEIRHIMKINDCAFAGVLKIKKLRLNKNIELSYKSFEGCGFDGKDIQWL